MPVFFNGACLDSRGNTHASFSARMFLDRNDFGLSFNQPLESGGMVLGNVVTIELEIDAVREAGEGAGSGQGWKRHLSSRLIRL